MTAATAAAAADRLATAVRDQARAYSAYYPECVPAFIQSHTAAATAPRAELAEALRATEISEPILQQLRHLPANHSVNIQFTGQDAASLALWSKWRYVYDIDPDLLGELGDSVDDDTVIPDGLFNRLPHPDPFIAFPKPIELPLQSTRAEDAPGGVQHVEGFMVTGRVPYYQDTVLNYQTATLQRSTSDAASTQIGLMISSTIWNADGSPRLLPGGFPDMVLTRVTIPTGGRVGDILAEILTRFTANAEIRGHEDMVPIMVRQAIATLIYLCSINSEMRPVAAPVCKRLAKQLGRAHGAKPSRIIEVGYQVGSALRAYARRANPKMPYEHSGRSVRPHLRRAHFHTFRVGPGRPNERTETVVKWISPIPINATDDPAGKTTVIGVRR